MHLTVTERLAVQGVVSEQVRLQQQFAERDAVLRQVFAEIEGRVGLPAGSLGQSYVVDLEAGMIRETAPNGTALSEPGDDDGGGEQADEIFADMDG